MSFSLVCIDLDKLAEPADHAEEIIENIEAGLNSFRIVAAALTHTANSPS